MLGWLRNWVTKRQRQLFSYYDGSGWRLIDPYAVWVALRSDEELVLDVDIPAMDRGDDESTAKVIRAVHRAFGTRPFDGKRGITVREARELLLRFVVYLNELKKNSVPTLTSLPSTDGRDSEDELVTSSDSGSCSTVSESKSDVATEL